MPSIIQTAFFLEALMNGYAIVSLIFYPESTIRPALNTTGWSSAAKSAAKLNQTASLLHAALASSSLRLRHNYYSHYQTLKTVLGRGSSSTGHLALEKQVLSRCSYGKPSGTATKEDLNAEEA